MKKAFSFMVIFSLLAWPALAARTPVDGKNFELGTAMSFASYKWADGGESSSMANIFLRAGWFIWGGLEIEPELMMTKFEGSDAVFVLSGNLAYNFRFGGKMVPFVLAGFGFGNGLGLAGIVEGGSSIDSTLLNFGGGLKYIIGSSAALRLEYRFSHYRFEYDYYEDVENLNQHQLLIGVSVFF